MRVVPTLSLILASSLACGGALPVAVAPPIAPVAPAAPESKGDEAAPDSDAPPALPANVPRDPPAPTGPPDRTDKVFEAPADGSCLGPGRYEVRHPGDRVPSVLVVEGARAKTLVVALHGGGGNARKILRQTRLDGLAKQQGGVAVLVPHAADMAGHGPHWNTGKFTDILPPGTGRDDVAYLDGLVDKVQGAVCAERVLGVGFSNGGQMVHRWACQGSSLDAVLSGAGTLLVDPATCKGPMPLRSYVGTEDRIYREPPRAGTDQPNVPESAELWAKINRCDPEPTFSEDEHRRCAVWSGCAAPVTLCAVKGFPHGWPAPWARRKPTQVNATTEGWAWFRDLSAD